MVNLIKKFSSMPVTVKAAIAYTIAGFLARGLHLLTTPLFTRIMTIEQIGVVSNYSTWSSYLSTIVALGLTSGAINIALKEYKADRDGYVKSSQTLSLISVIMFATIMAIIYPFVSDFMGMPWYYVALMFATMLFSFSQSFWMSWQRYEYKYKAVTSVTVGVSVLSTLIALIAVIFAKRNGITDLVSVRIFASGFVALLFSVPIFIYIYTRKKPLIKREYVVFSLQTGLPMVVHSFSKSLLSASDRVMINAMIGARALGLYSVLYTVSSLSIIAWEAVNSSFVPYFFENLEKDNGIIRIRKISQFLLLMFGAISFLLALFAPELVLLIGGNQYMTAVYVAPPVAAGIFFIAVYSLYGNVLMYYKKTKFVMYCTLSAGIFNVLANILFIPHFGYIAAAYTTLVSYVFMAIIYAMISRKLSKKDIYGDHALWRTGAVVVIMCLLCNLIYKETVIRYSVIVIILLVLLYYKNEILSTIKTIKKKS